MNCFKGLSGFDAEKQEEIVDGFLENSVLNQQGWSREFELEDLHRREHNAD